MNVSTEIYRSHKFIWAIYNDVDSFFLITLFRVRSWNNGVRYISFSTCILTEYGCPSIACSLSIYHGNVSCTDPYFINPVINIYAFCVWAWLTNEKQTETTKCHHKMIK